jgi:hypothetical protein
LFAVFCVAGLFGAASAATVTQAYAQQIADDTCGTTIYSPFYYPEGPAGGWVAVPNTSGPTGISGRCMMYTSNTSYYHSISYDNTSYWYLDTSINSTGSYTVWAFVPSVGATTTQAVYEYWPVGHNMSAASMECSVNQLRLSNVYAQLCGADLRDNSWHMCADNNASCGGFWRLTDATGEPDNTSSVGSDEFDYCNGGFCGQNYGQNFSSQEGVAIRSAKSGRCLDADLNTIGHNGTKVQLWDCNGSTQQHWYWVGVTDLSSVASTVVSVKSGRCLDADLNTIGHNGTKVQLWDCLNTPGHVQANQWWDRVSPGYGTVQNVDGSRCLDADLNTIGSNGTKVQLWDCGGSPQQHWLPL